MSEKNVHFQDIMEREKGLQRGLTTRQLTMIAIGGAIGTGLFLGSGMAIGFAGPGVIVSYLIGAVIALLLMGCLAEMTVAHPTTGSFGAHAERYINPWAGFTVRYSYWFSLVCAVGTEVSAMSVYMKYWFPAVPGVVWILIFSAVLIYVNATSVNLFGTVEYWFSMIKVTAIILFIVLGAFVVFGSSSHPEMGIQNLTANGGFFPNGFWGMWIAIFISLFSYLSIEMIAVSAGEAKEPEKAVPIALKSAVVRLVLFYILTLALMLMIVPWNETGSDRSPFVKVFELIHIPGAAGIMNFVVLTAALSAMNSQLYISTRMVFSLSRGGFAPKKLGELSKKGVPVKALALSTIGIAIATIVGMVVPDSSFAVMISLSSFGAMFAWFMVFVTHLFFRRKWEQMGGRKLPVRMIGYPYLSVLGAVLLASVVLSTWFQPEFKDTLRLGFPWLILITICYFIWKKANPTAFQQPTDPIDKEISS
ncbi:MULTISPECIES: amino acid permease [Brevibacillus]|jgi:L-asparagine transporter-like permease|uniref:Amino acid permease n=1 Tax=Brevibacillus borstelensis AK1 TaxID=1300222 RepID=M8D9N4_9BACL|nr:amino acid permease [Brevibacillus borstelensis]EMT50068.1 amino acid permease [Brevibacillus borstelensis AK1]MED1872494.1 amino acid permease [Brevibacillus borstelensis]MED1885611.1 amino acid permease [Brevibacillus borstelensis]RNB64072.1 amino acid permease [Brevibacillus borstelensis]GED54165.1 amino acid permease [Brevibacillus borstelensis]